MSALMIWAHGIPMTLPEINYFLAQQQDICKMVCPCTFKAVTLSALCLPRNRAESLHATSSCSP